MILGKKINPKSLLKFYVPYECFVDEEKSIVFNKNGSLQKTFKIRYADLEYSVPEVENDVILKINNALKRLDENFTLQFEIQRKSINKDKEHIEKESVPPPTLKIWEKQEEKANYKSFFRTEYYLTITYNIEFEVQNGAIINMLNAFRAKSIKYNQLKAEKILNESLDTFNTKINDFINRLYNVTLAVEEVKGEELLGFLYSQVNMEFRERIEIPRNIHIDELVSVSNLKYNNKTAKINDLYFATISLFDFPDSVRSRIFESLESLNFEFRFSSRFNIISKEETNKMFVGYRTHYKGQTRNGIQYVIEALTKKQSENIDETANERAEEVNEALNRLKRGEAIFGFYSSNIIVFDKNYEQLQKKINEISKIITSNDFICKNDTINVFDSYLGSMAGNIQRNKRRYILPSFVFTCLIPISSNFLGYSKNYFFNAPALLTAKTRANDLFYFNLHVGDVGHTFIVGQTGGGKSVLLGLIASQFMKYKNAQIFFFDKDRSARVLTECSNGVFYDLGGDDFSFQIMEKIDDSGYRTFVKEWLLDILEIEGVKITPEVRNYLFESVDQFSLLPKEIRTFNAFLDFMPNKDLDEAFRMYATGNYRKYFNKGTEIDTKSQFHTFEMGNIMNNEKLSGLILSYLFHYIEYEKLNDGNPTLIILDEAWLALKNEKMKDKIEEWLRVLRKKNASVIFATQSLTEINNSSISSVILDQCKTKIYLPNENARAYEDLYIKMGLNLSEIEKIRYALPKKEYLYKSERGSNMISFDLSKLELAYLGSSRADDLKKIAEIIKDNKDTEKINKEWLDYKGC